MAPCGALRTANSPTSFHEPVPRVPQQDDVPPKYSIGDFYAALHVKTAVKGFVIRHKLRPVFEKYEAEAAEAAAAADSSGGWPTDGAGGAEEGAGAEEGRGYARSVRSRSGAGTARSSGGGSGVGGVGGAEGGGRPKVGAMRKFAMGLTASARFRLLQGGSIKRSGAGQV